MIAFCPEDFLVDAPSFSAWDLLQNDPLLDNTGPDEDGGSALTPGREDGSWLGQEVLAGAQHRFSGGEPSRAVSPDAHGRDTGEDCHGARQGSPSEWSSAPTMADSDCSDCSELGDAGSGEVHRAGPRKRKRRSADLPLRQPAATTKAEGCHQAALTAPDDACGGRAEPECATLMHKDSLVAMFTALLPSFSHDRAARLLARHDWSLQDAVEEARRDEAARCDSAICIRASYSDIVALRPAAKAQARRRRAQVGRHKVRRLEASTSVCEHGVGGRQAPILECSTGVLEC